MASEKKPAFLYHFDALEEPRIDRKNSIHSLRSYSLCYVPAFVVLKAFGTLSPLARKN